MHLYNVTLQPPTAITHSIVGNFSGDKQQEILTCKGGKILELYRVDADTGKMISILSREIFGIVRSLITVRLTGSLKDYIVVGSDSGSIAILEYNKEENAFEKVHQEPYGKAGCRRITPGQYLAADPKGRAVMIGAVEKQKFVYVLNRDTENRLTISSPLEAHKSHLITFSLVSLDVGFENPVFACIEYDYHDFDRPVAGNEPPKKLLTFYELDLGLNHVVRKYSDPVDESASLLIPLPSGKEGPGGVLVCSEGKITWKNQGINDVEVILPKRSDDVLTRKDLIVSHALHKMKDFFFILAQTENGDLFKITCESDGDSVQELKAQYFDTIPTAVNINILKSGFLFCAAEFGNNYLYQIESLGDDANQEAWSSSAMLNDNLPTFETKKLANLSPVDELVSSNPNIQSKVRNVFGDDAPQVFSICGTGLNSSFKILRHGLEVSEIISYPLPGSPSGVWGLKTKKDDPYHAYIVLSFINATLVLSVGETVEEVTDCGFFLDGPTLNCYQVGEQSIVQIHERGIRHIHSNGKISEWEASEDHHVSHSSCNNKQIAIVLSGKEIVYFELDDLENLSEYQERKTMGADITCIAIGPVPEGRQRTKFLTVGCADKTIRLMSLSPDSMLQSLGMQAVNAGPSSILISEFSSSDTDRSLPTYYLNVGLDNGVFVRTVLDSVTGALSDSRSRYLGPLPVKLFNVQVDGREAVLAVSSKPWLNYMYQKKVTLEPLTYEKVDFGSSFVSEQVPEGILAIAGNTLRILAVDNLGNVFNTTSIPLQMTPRQLEFEEATKKFLIVEADHRAEISQFNEHQEANGKHEEEEEEEETSYTYNTSTRKDIGKCASLVRVLDPISGETDQIVPLGEQEFVTALTRCQFHVSPTEIFYVIAVAVNLQLAPRKCDSSLLYVYRLAHNGSLELYHKTEVFDGMVGALTQFQGRLLAGIGKTLRIYDLGKKKLLRKTETSVFPSYISGLKVQGDRIYVSDVQHSVLMARYIFQENVIVLFADDPSPRWMTRFAVLDYNTICGSDKFGNIFIKRLSKVDIEELEDDLTGVKMLHEKGFLNGAGKKLQQICEVYIGDMATSLERCTLVAGGREIIMYTTLMGSVGLLIPFPSREDVELFTTLEMHMRQELPPLCGRDHLAYRSFYFPVKSVVDGDLVELYNELPWERRQTIAEELERTPTEIARQIELIRARVS